MGFLRNTSVGVSNINQAIPQNITKNLIGRGANYPFSFSDTLGGISGTTISEGIQKINSNIYFVLTTRKGQYFMHPAFGSNIEYMLMEPYEPSLIPRLQLESTDAIAKWVPQIQLLSTSVSLDELDNDMVNIQGTYAVRGTPFKGSFVFPFNLGSGGVS